MLKKYMLKLIVCYVLLILCVACSSIQNERPTTIETIGDLKYYDESSTYRIYLMEGERYVPFLVIENYENGSTLLLREFLLDELQIYNYDYVEYPTYYATSYIDNYLNTEYAGILSKEISNLIQKTDIEITSLNGLKNHKNETEKISRKIFLLSATEVGSYFYIHPREGSELMYFRNRSIKAYHENGISESWFLRTATWSQDDALISVSYDGSIGKGRIKDMIGLACIGIRPAFRISSSIPVTLSSDIVDGQEVYIIKN